MIELRIACLNVDVAKEVDSTELKEIYAELDGFCKEIADVLGAIRLPSYTSPTLPTHPETTRTNIFAATKLVEYAGKVTDFTIKSASEALNVPEQTLYASATKLVKDGIFKREQVAGGVAYIYSLARKPKQMQESLVILPNNKVPFPARKDNPEREKMQFLRG